MDKAFWFGADVVASYGDVDAEYNAVRDSAGVVDLSWRGKVRFVGPDRHKWLQGQVTNDVLNLACGKGQEACVCEVKGHILAFLKIYNPGEYLLADVNPDICAGTIQTLDFYRIMEKVEVQNATDELGLIGVYGPRSQELLAGRLEGWKAKNEYDCVERESDGIRRLIIQSRVTGDDGYEVYAPRAAIAQLQEELAAHGASPIGMDALNILRIENGRPWQPFELNEGIFPHEAGIENRAVSFTKGCYIGQETIARIHSRGHVNRKLVRLNFSGDLLPAHSDRIHAPDTDKDIGWVTSAARSPKQGQIGMGYVRREYSPPGTKLVVKSGERRIAAEVAVNPIPSPLPS